MPPNLRIVTDEVWQDPRQLAVAAPQVEYAVLQSILTAPDAIGIVQSFLTPEDFSQPQCAALYQAMCTLHREGIPPSLDLVYPRFPDAVMNAGLREMNSALTTHLHLVFYARMVKEASIRRQLHELGQSVTNEAFVSHDVMESMRRLEQELRRLQVQPLDEETDKPKFLAKLFEDLIGDFQEDETVIGTGLRDLDTKLNGGLRRGDLIVPAGRPGLGKSALAGTILHHVGVKRRIPCRFYSAEMPRQQIFERLLSIQTQIPYREVRSHRLSEAQERCMAEATAIFSDAPFDVVSAANWTIEEIAAHAQRQHEHTPLGLIVIDYLQRLRYVGKAENRTNELRIICMGAKSLALELGTPVLALSQLNRQSEGRPDKMPVLSDLKDSGAIEQEGDQVWLISRLGEDTIPLPPVQQVALDVAKYRNGETGLVRVGFRGPYMQFVDYVADKDRSR